MKGWATTRTFDEYVQNAAAATRTSLLISPPNHYLPASLLLRFPEISNRSHISTRGHQAKVRIVIHNTRASVAVILRSKYFVAHDLTRQERLAGRDRGGRRAQGGSVASLWHDLGGVVLLDSAVVAAEVEGGVGRVGAAGDRACDLYGRC